MGAPAAVQRQNLSLADSGQLPDNGCQLALMVQLQNGKAGFFIFIDHRFNRAGDLH